MLHMRNTLRTVDRDNADMSRKESNNDFQPTAIPSIAIPCRFDMPS
jgi:hypothetical protein